MSSGENGAAQKRRYGSTSLQTRALMLVAVPLILQTIFLSALIVLFLFEKQAAIEEDRRKEIIGQSQEIAIVAGEAIQSVLLAARMDSNSDAGSVRKRLDAIQNQAAKVCEILSSEKEQAENIAELRGAAANFREVLERFHKSSDYTTRKAQKLLQVEGVNISGRYIAVTKHINDIEKQKSLQSAAAKETWRFWLQCCLLFALGGGIIAALILTRIYILNVRKPMNQLTENTRRLSNRQPLLTSLPGDDELSRLDKFLHEVYISIEEALQREIALVDNAADMICSLNRDGIFQKVNPYSKTLLGYAPDSLLGKSIIDVAKPESAANIDLQIYNAVGSPEMQSLEMELKTQDGQIKDCMFSSYWSPRDEQLFCVIHDVTEEKNLEHLKQEFINMVSHDLRSPLTSLLSRLTLLVNGVYGAMPDQATDELMTAEQNCRRLIDLINDLLEFEKLKSGNLLISPIVCQVKALVADSVRMIESQADSKNISIELEGERFELSCDAARIRQVFVNLLTNSLNDTPDGSKIIVKWNRTPDVVKFQIIDKGNSLSAETQSSIFTAFDQSENQDQYQMDSNRLALSICKMIVVAHGGEIGVQSDPDKGNTYWFTVPLTISSAPSPMNP